MRQPLLLPIMVVAATLGAVVAGADDHPVDGLHLLLQSKPNGRERLLYLSRDSSLSVPAARSADDPLMADSAGAVLELLSPVSHAVFVLPGGRGRPGWTAHGRRARAVMRYMNPDAPDGPSAVKNLVMRPGRELSIAGRAMGLDPGVSHGSVGVRLTVGSTRFCSRFDAPTIQHDRPGKFSARFARALVLADCSDASLLGYEPTTTTSSTTTSTTTSTSTSTTVPAGVVFGNDVEFPDASAHSVGYLTGFAVSLPLDCTVTHLALIGKAAGPNFRLGLYTNSGGSPGTLVVGTPVVPLAAATIEVPVTATPVAAGTYWLMAMFDQDASVGVDFSDPSAAVQFSMVSFGAGLPSPVFFPQSFWGQRFNYYVRVQP